MKKIIIISAIILALIFLGFTTLFNNNKVSDLEKEEGKDEKIKIVTTLFPYYDMAKEIGKEKVEVSLLLPFNTDPHHFEPRPSDIIEINNSDIFVYTGEFFEVWANEVIKNISSNTFVIEASKDIELIEEKNEEDEDIKEESNDNHSVDPHLWLDFANVKKIADNISDRMIEIYPEDELFFTENLNKYIDDLEILDDSFRASLKNCKKNEIIYSGHNAFSYFARRYNLEHSSLLNVSKDSEPTIDSLVSIIEKIKTEDIQYIFYEEMIDPRIAETIKEETGVEIIELNPVGTISLEDFNNGISFLDVMEKNINNLTIGLQCNLESQD